jgi:hypothetical protein
VIYLFPERDSLEILPRAQLLKLFPLGSLSSTAPRLKIRKIFAEANVPHPLLEHTIIWFRIENVPSQVGEVFSTYAVHLAVPSGLLEAEDR